MKPCDKKLEGYRLKLKNNLTPKEIIVCRILNKKNIKNKKPFYISQYVIPPYIVDFYIPTRGLIIEIDGGVHNTNRQRERDYKREDYLMSLGLMIQRFSNNDKEDYISKTIDSYIEISNNLRCRNDGYINKLKILSEKFDILGGKFNNYREAIDSYSSYCSIEKGQGL